MLSCQAARWLSHQPVGSGCRAIRDGQADAFAVAVEQNVVHPCINANAVDANAVVADVVQPGADLRFRASISRIKTVPVFAGSWRNGAFHEAWVCAFTAVPGGEHYAAAGCA